MPELDQHFSDMAETFNQQQEQFETMVRHITNLKQLYGCNRSDSLALAECLGLIRAEHGEQRTPSTVKQFVSCGFLFQFPSLSSSRGQAQGYP